MSSFRAAMQMILDAPSDETDAQLLARAAKARDAQLKWEEVEKSIGGAPEPMHLCGAACPLWSGSWRR